MTIRRALMIDISEKNLDPRRPHAVVSADGRLKGRVHAETEASVNVKHKHTKTVPVEEPIVELSQESIEQSTPEKNEVVEVDQSITTSSLVDVSKPEERDSEPVDLELSTKNDLALTPKEEKKVEQDQSLTSNKKKKSKANKVTNDPSDVS